VIGQGDVQQRHVFLVSLPVIIGCRYAAFIPAGLYRGIWRFAGARDAGAVVGAVAISEFVAVGIISVTFDIHGFPYRIFALDAILSTLLIGGSRFAERALHRVLGALKARESRRRTLIVGAGRGGRSLLRELRETAGEQVVGFVDDDPRLRRRRMQGVLVLGGSREIAWILERAQPHVVLVTIPNAPRERLDAIVEACERAGIRCWFVRRETDLDPVTVLGSAAR
jgi:FlaA1/EpsC-like NDP-sugar epimerase